MSRILIAPVASAPKCRSHLDLYELAARQTLSKLFKNYVAAMGATPIETLHSAAEIKRLQDTGDIVHTAISRVAGLHAKGNQAESKALRDQYHGFVEQIAQRARTAADLALPAIDKDGYAQTVAAIAAHPTWAADASYLIRTAMARHTTKSRMGWDKIATLLGWFEAAGTAPTEAIDDFLSDQLADIKFLEQLPGIRRNLAEMLQFFADLAEGIADGARWHKDKDSAAVVTRLARAISTDRLPLTRNALGDRIAQQLDSGLPLSKDKPSEEVGSFVELVLRLIPADRPMMAQGLIAEGLIKRQARIMNKSGPSGHKDAAVQILGMLTDSGPQARFLLALAESAEASNVYDLITKKLDSAIKGVHRIEGYDGRPGPIDIKLRGVTSLHRQIAASSLPDLSKAQLRKHLDDVLLRHFKERDRLAEWAGDARNLHERSCRLISLCLPERLPPGPVSEFVRAQVLASLKQPNFETELIAHVDEPVAQAAALRDFFGLMQRAGFI